MNKAMSITGLFVLGLALGTAADDTAGSEPDALLVEMKEPVEVLRLDEEAYAPGKAGMALHAGDTIRTGKKGRAFVRMSDDVELRLGSETIVEIQLTEDADVPVRSVACYLGLLMTQVNRPEDGETPFEVHTSNAVAGVRGTAFTTAVALDGAVRTSVTEGKVVFEAGDGSVDLTPGTFSEAELDAAPAAPAVEKETDWEAWRRQRAEKLLAHAPEVVERWSGRAERQRERLEALVAKAGRLGDQIDEMSRKARVARHGGHRKALRRIKRRLVRIMAQTIRTRRQIRRTAARLRGLTVQLRRFARMAEEHGQLTDELKAKLTGMADNQKRLRAYFRKTRQTLIRRQKQRGRRERKLLREMRVRYRDLLEQNRERHRKLQQER